MSITKISFSGTARRAVTHVDSSEFQKNLATASLNRSQKADAAPAVSTAASAATSTAASTAASTASAALAPRTNFALRQQLFRVAPPVLTDAPDADGRTGSYRRAVEGIDPTIPGNPGFADYFGLGGTAAVEAQAERNKGVVVMAAGGPGSAIRA